MLYLIEMISEAKLKAYVTETPHSSLVATGIGFAMTVALS